MACEVVITGAGVVSSLGHSPAELHDALCAGRRVVPVPARFAEAGVVRASVTAVDLDGLESSLGGRSLRALDRTGRLVTLAVGGALDSSSWSATYRGELEVGLIVGTMFCSLHSISEFDRRGLVAGPQFVSPLDFPNTVLNAAAGQAAIFHGLRGINATIAAGEASGLQAIAFATDLIRWGRALALVAGGADELSYEASLAFEREGYLAPSPQCDAPLNGGHGVVLSEGACFLSLANRRALKVGSPILATVKGTGASVACAGGIEDLSRAIAHAIRVALCDARVRPPAIDVLSLSRSGRAKTDEAESAAIRAVFGSDPVPAFAIKSMVGETLGASGALQVVEVVEAMRDGRVPETDRVNCPRLALINSVSAAGNCCSVVIEAFDEVRA